MMSVYHSELVWIPIVYCVMSVFTFIAYGIDKRNAKKERTRIPESTLHIYAVLGGWPGALCAQKFFRHKTQKQPFKKWLLLTVVLNLLLLIAACLRFFLHS